MTPLTNVEESLEQSSPVEPKVVLNSSQHSAITCSSRFSEEWCSDSSIDSSDMINIMPNLDNLNEKNDASESTEALSESESDQGDDDIYSRFAKAMEEENPSRSSLVRFDPLMSLQVQEYEPPEVSCHEHLYYSCHQLQRMIDDERQRERDLEAVGGL